MLLTDQNIFYIHTFYIVYVRSHDLSMEFALKVEIQYTEYIMTKFRICGNRYRVVWFDVFLVYDFDVLPSIVSV